MIMVAPDVYAKLIEKGAIENQDITSIDMARRCDSPNPPKVADRYLQNGYNWPESGLATRGFDTTNCYNPGSCRNYGSNNIYAQLFSI